MASKASKQAPLAWKVTKRSGASRKAPASSGAGTQRRVKPRRAEAGKPEAKTDDGEGHTPVALWQTVEYQPRGQEKDKAVLTAFAFVEGNFVIPKDIEGERFGPLSGTSFERRVVDAYEHGRLHAKPGCRGAVGTALCSTCGDQGHSYRDCPDGF